MFDFFSHSVLISFRDEDYWSTKHCRSPLAEDMEIVMNKWPGTDADPGFWSGAKMYDHRSMKVLAQRESFIIAIING